MTIPTPTSPFLPQGPPGGGGDSDARVPRSGDGSGFLHSHRAFAICTKEFDLLADEIARQVKELDVTAGGGQSEIRRAPNRCIVQVGPIALTISWLRSGSETITEGRLLVIEWVGIVGRGAKRFPERVAERSPAKPERPPATIASEATLRADASSADDWRWRREDGVRSSYSSMELATLWVESLRKRLAALTP